MSRFTLFVVSILLLATPVHSYAFDHRHADWTSLLQQHVVWSADGTASQVDYAALQKNRSGLKGYLRTLSAVSQDEFYSWSRVQQLAFLINAYNAFTVELILSKYPDLKSIKDLGGIFSSPWKQKFLLLLGKRRHLDGVEHELIRGSRRYNEPLIHFAVNCASIGCPALRNEAFVADRLDEQLLDQTRRFLTDRSRNRFDTQSGKLQVSSIFDWYEADFEQGWRQYHSMKDFVSIHAKWFSEDPDGQKLLMEGKFRIEYLDYDWRLNQK